MPYQTEKTKEQIEKLYEEHQTFLIVCVYSTLFINDICCGLVIDAMEKMKKSKYYRHKAKQYVNKIDIERRNYEKMMNKIVEKAGKSEYFANSNERFSEGVVDDITRLHFAFKQVFDREHLDDSSLLAYVETARTLCEFSCKCTDKRMEEMARIGAEFKNTPLLYLRMTKLSKLLDEVMDTFKPGKKINLDIEECQRALDVVMLKMGDIDAIANAINE